jgi:hypothetical protein
MNSADFVTIYTSFNDLDAVKSIFPRVLAESDRTGTALIVHDCSTKDTAETWDWYQEMAAKHRFVHLFSNRIPFAIARNTCRALAFEMFAPQHICMLEDDHGYETGAIDALRQAMIANYGRQSPNGLKYGLFSLCPNHWGESFRVSCHEDGQGNLYPAQHLPPMQLGGANSCCRCAPASHWQSVLKGYDVDEYPISFYQTRNLNFRNYNRGFTTLYVGGGKLVHALERPGNGEQLQNRAFDDNFTGSDQRSRVRRRG